MKKECNIRSFLKKKNKEELLTFPEASKKYKISMSSLRWNRFNNINNFNECVVQIGRYLYISPEKLNKWSRSMINH
jgi:hypothetical protein